MTNLGCPWKILMLLPAPGTLHPLCLESLRPGILGCLCLFPNLCSDFSRLLRSLLSILHKEHPPSTWVSLSPLLCSFLLQSTHHHRMDIFCICLFSLFTVFLSFPLTKITTSLKAGTVPAMVTAGSSAPGGGPGQGRHLLNIY